MMNEAVLLDTGMKSLAKEVGLVEAERFISLILREPFDYTKWRKDNLFVGMSVKEISDAAKKYCDENPEE